MLGEVLAAMLAGVSSVHMTLEFILKRCGFVHSCVDGTKQWTPYVHVCGVLLLLSFL